GRSPERRFRGLRAGLRQSRSSQKDPALQAGLDARSQCTEIADTLHFVVRQLDAEMGLKARKHFERLQAVDPQLLEELVLRRKGTGRHFEVRGSELQDFGGRLFERAHTD